MAETKDALQAIGMLPDIEIELAQAAVQLARIDAPDDDWMGASAHLSELAREASAIGRVLSGRSLDIRVGALAGLIHARHRYAGDHETYDDLDNANLIRVIARRKGLPVSLGLLWLHCVRAAGWQAHGVDFPGHFLIAMQTASDDGQAAQAPERPSRQQQRVLVDPFDCGAILGSTELLTLLQRLGASADLPLQPGMTRPMSNRDVLLRLQRNIVQRRLRSGGFEAALDALNGMLLIAPDTVANWLEAAELNRRLGHVRAAMHCLEQVLALTPAAEVARLAEAMLTSLKNGPTSGA